MTIKKKNNSLLTLFGVILTGVILYLTIFNDTLTKGIKEKEREEYPRIENSAIEYKGFIMSKKLSKTFKGVTLFTLSSSIKFSISQSTRNYYITNLDVDYFLQIGDSIYKPKLSDSLYIFRDSKEYIFILGKKIN